MWESQMQKKKAKKIRKTPKKMNPKEKNTKLKTSGEKLIVRYSRKEREARTLRTKSEQTTTHPEEKERETQLGESSLSLETYSKLSFFLSPNFFCIYIYRERGDIKTGRNG